MDKTNGNQCVILLYYMNKREGETNQHKSKKTCIQILFCRNVNAKKRF